MELKKEFEYLDIFSTPIWITCLPKFLDITKSVGDLYLSESNSLLLNQVDELNKQLGKDIGDFGLSNHSFDIYKDHRLKNFTNYCLETSKDYLDSCGFDLSNYDLRYSEMWVQEFSSKGGTYHDAHVHYDSHVSGFYFLECSDKTSYPIFHDPRAGALATKLPLKEIKKISYGNEKIFIKPKPGTMIIFPSYLTHSYALDYGIDKFKFIHWNIQCIRKNIYYEN